MNTIFEQIFVYLSDNAPMMTALFTSLFATTVTVIVLRVLPRSLMVARAHQIALIGFPKSGKTTLITTFFGDIFRKNYYRKKVTLRGQGTIERVNRDLELLESGKTVQPTTEKDIFTYRADVTTDRIFFSRRYKVEIGDFPGENTVDFTKKYGDWIHNTPYFKWVVDADVFVFVIDLAFVLTDSLDQPYRAKISKAIRAAWQSITDVQSDRGGNLRGRKIVLVFSKADLLLHLHQLEARKLDKDEIESTIQSLGNGEGFNHRDDHSNTDIDYAFRIGRTSVENDYRDLIGYLNSQVQNFEVVFFSYLSPEYSQGIGIEKLIGSLLPK